MTERHWEIPSRVAARETAFLRRGPERHWVAKLVAPHS